MSTPAVAAPTENQTLSDPVLYLFSVACATTVANIYFNQPLLDLLAKYFHTTPSGAGNISTAAAVGYDLGLLFFVPLGDIMERRKLVLTLIAACTLMLLGAALAPTLALLVLFQLLIGLTATSAQILIPLGIEMSPPSRRGRTVGVLMSGVLSGILLARTVAGFIATALGWQAVFYIAALLMAGLFFMLRAVLPHRPPTLKLSYGGLMKSLLALTRTPGLLSPTIVSALSFGTFIAFWTALSFVMHDQFNKGAAEAGAFGIVGLAGALAAPLAGKLSDRRGPYFTITLAILLSAAAFLLMTLHLSIPSLILGVLLMDLGVQSIQVAAQSEVITLIPEARSRLNTLYMTSRFAAAAFASKAAAFAYTHAQWSGVATLCLALTALALLLHLTLPSKTSPLPHPSAPSEDPLFAD